MKMWWAAGLAMIIAVSAVGAETVPDVLTVKDPDGGTIGLIVDCNTCQSAKGASKPCFGGAEEGWLAGKACGQCLITENYGATFTYAYDIHFTGKLTDAAGKPLENRFVKLFMANGWNIRSRTFNDGRYRMMLGATAERKSTKPLIVDLGTRVDSPKVHDKYYALFFLPQSYKPCPASAAKDDGKKP